MKAKAGRLEGQLTVLEQTADVPLRITHQLLVPQVQDLTGQHRVPVIHERQVAAVVAAEVVQVVAEGLPVREVLLEGAEARVQRMPARIDDGRVWQDRVDQAHVTEIVGQLVGEALMPAPQRRRLGDVTSAERGELRV